MLLSLIPSKSPLVIGTSYFGRQASGSLTVIDGETIVYTYICLADAPSELSDFFPLSVHYQECFLAAGWTSGGFFKQEGRAKDHEKILTRGEKIEIPANFPCTTTFSSTRGSAPSLTVVSCIFRPHS